jgi:SAM-dependent methyltransferase
MSHSGWSQGYVTDTNYTDHFFRELSPVWLNYVAALNGAPPHRLDPSFTYLELGCGFGSSTIVNAGAFRQGEFHACDFNPAHFEGAMRQASALGISNIQFHETSFQHLLALDLPAFDFIVLHGVYSWIGAAARQAIRGVIGQTLKPGGLVYLSYNCLPGWSIEAPLRKLLLELAATGVGGSPQRTEQALRSVKQLSDSKLRHFTANQRFRRDVFVRGRERLGRAETTRHIHAVAIGSLGNPERIGTKVKVPRGELRFQEDFIRELQALMLGGSVTIGEAVTALGGEGRDEREITRNLILWCSRN